MAGQGETPTYLNDSVEQKEARRIATAMIGAAVNYLSQLEDWQEVPLGLLEAVAEGARKDLNELVTNKGTYEIQNSSLKGKIDLTNKSQLADQIRKSFFVYGDYAAVPKDAPNSSNWANADLPSIAEKFKGFLAGRELGKSMMKKIIEVQ